MAWGHSTDTEIVVDGTDLSVFCNTSNFARTAGTQDVTTYGANSVMKVGTLRDATFSMGGFYDTGAAGTPAVVLPPLLGATVTIVRRPQGTGTGKPEETFSAVLKNYTESAPVAEYIQWSAEFECSGDIQTSTQQ